MYFHTNVDILAAIKDKGVIFFYVLIFQWCMNIYSVTLLFVGLSGCKIHNKYINTYFWWRFLWIIKYYSTYLYNFSFLFIYFFSTHLFLYCLVISYNFATYGCCPPCLWFIYFYFVTYGYCLILKCVHNYLIIFYSSSVVKMLWNVYSIKFLFIFCLLIHLNTYFPYMDS